MTQPSESARRSRGAIGDGCVILSERAARVEGSLARFGMSEGCARSVAAIGNGCVIPGERERGPGSKWGIGCEGRNLGPGLRRDDDDRVIPSLRSGQAPGECERDPGSSVFLDERTTLEFPP